MSVRTRHCRAFDCPRRVNDRVLFCNVHWVQLPPKLQRPIESNQEAPANATVNGVRGVATGVANAVAYIARKEGRSRSLDTAQKAAASAPATGTAADTDTSGGAAAAVGGGGAAGGGSGTTRFTSRV